MLKATKTNNFYGDGLLMVFLAALLSAAIGSAEAQGLYERAAKHGKALVEANCANCHAVGTDDKSTHRDAPPFRYLLRRYPIDALEESFAGTIYTDHEDMPEFIVTREQLSDILIYIETIQQP